MTLRVFVQELPFLIKHTNFLERHHQPSLHTIRRVPLCLIRSIGWSNLIVKNGCFLQQMCINKKKKMLRRGQLIHGGKNALILINQEYRRLTSHWSRVVV